jgi:hypothetical protein
MSPFFMLDCLKANTTDGDAKVEINIRVGCCNRRIKKKLSKADSSLLVELAEMDDEQFQRVLKYIREEALKKLNNNK